MKTSTTVLTRDKTSLSFISLVLKSRAGQRTSLLVTHTNISKKTIVFKNTLSFFFFFLAFHCVAPAAHPADCAALMKALPLLVLFCEPGGAVFAFPVSHHQPLSKASPTGKNILKNKTKSFQCYLYDEKIVKNSWSSLKVQETDISVESPSIVAHTE